MLLAAHGIGRLKEDVMVHQLLPEVAKFRGITDVIEPVASRLALNANETVWWRPHRGLTTRN